MAEIDYEQICGKVREIAARVASYIESESENFSWDDVELKGMHNMVTNVDCKAEEMIIAELEPLIPGADFLAEEAVDAADGPLHPKDTDYTWIIDPLDGTTNYMHRLPPYCVSVALSFRGEIVVGVVHEVTRGESFYAWKGSKAYMNGKEIGVSQINILDESLIATGFSYDSLDRMAEYRLQQEYFIKYTHGGRRIGSAAANLAYVACGRFDGFSQFNLSPWDVAAGSLIVRAAGGVVTDYHGGDNYIHGKEIVACNRLIYDKYLEAISATIADSEEFYPVG